MEIKIKIKRRERENQTLELKSSRFMEEFLPLPHLQAPSFKLSKNGLQSLSLSVSPSNEVVLMFLNSKPFIEG